MNQQGPALDSHRNPENLLRLYVVAGLISLVVVVLLLLSVFFKIFYGVVATAVALALLLCWVLSFSYVQIRLGSGHLKQARDRLETLAVTDALTEIDNRAHLLKRGEQESARIARNSCRNLPSACLGCILVDIDNFKSVNDMWGHQVGDQVLKGVAQRLRASVRPYDIIGRYGGEEFALLLPDTTFEQSLMVAERLRVAVNSEPFIIGGEELVVTVSLGVSCYNEKDRGLNDLLQRADEGLDKAKEGGHNRLAWVYPPFDSELHS